MTGTTQPAPHDRETERAIAELQRKLHGLQDNRAAAIRTINRDPGSRELVARFDREIASVLAELRELRPLTPGEQAAELESQIATAEANLCELAERKSAAVVAKLQRDPEGAARGEQIDAEIAETEARLQTLRQRHGALRQGIVDNRASARRKAAEATPLRIAELHRERAQLAETLTTAAHTLAVSFRAITVNGATLSELLDDQASRNFLSVGAFHRRAANAFAQAFAIDPNAPLTSINSMFGLRSNTVGARVHWTLAQWEQPGLDDLAPFYATEAEAEAARERLERRDSSTVAVPLHGAYTLARFEHVFGDEASARRAAARAAEPTAVVAHDGGFVLIPRRFAGEAA